MCKTKPLFYVRSAILKRSHCIFIYFFIFTTLFNHITINILYIYIYISKSFTFVGEGYETYVVVAKSPSSNIIYLVTNLSKKLYFD